MIQVCCSILGGGLHLLGLTFDLMASITGDLSVGRFQLAFCVFGGCFECVGQGTLFKAQVNSHTVAMD